jgi:predicted DNA-binding transcriptional regulator YafY
MGAARPMNRTERLTALLLLLQSCRERLTAAEVAAHFGVSRRTALRDMASLSAMGVPVESADGAAGGYSLPPGYNPAPLPLNLREAMLLLVALSGIEKLAAAPYGDARETLAAKLRALLSPAQCDAADALLGKVVLDVPDRRSHPAPLSRRPRHRGAQQTLGGGSLPVGEPGEDVGCHPAPRPPVRIRRLLVLRSIRPRARR